MYENLYQNIKIENFHTKNLQILFLQIRKKIDHWIFKILSLTKQVKIF